VRRSNKNRSFPQKPVGTLAADETALHHYVSFIYIEGEPMNVNAGVDYVYIVISTVHYVIKFFSEEKGNFTQVESTFSQR